ncbi:MAG: hypothetical protein F4Z74_07805 [Acidobacteria bacterium]|nr:hypothetical protein [Acidobacteriota bacterium]MYE44450.1 hypothetical protein [Acidobacteriota bacterium]
MARPTLVDNRSANTHGAALDALARDHELEHPLAAATAYVNLAGLHHLACATADGRTVRLLLGTAPPSEKAVNPLDAFRVAIEDSLREDRRFAAFPPSRAAGELGEVLAWLDRNDVEVRCYLAKFLHGKAYLFGDIADARAALVTSANLTAAGLTKNLELGLTDYQPHVARAAIGWFDGLWDDAADYKAELIKLLGTAQLSIEEPRIVFLRTLLELFGDDKDDVVRPGKVDLAPFQWEGYRRALRIVQKHHGVIYADGVGTGKTEIGLAFLEEYALRRGLWALVVVPAQLKQHWKDRINKAGLPGQVVSYQEFATDEQLTPPGTAHRARRLSVDKDAYRLVLADEGHAFRNPDNTWHRALSRLLGGEPKDLVLLTATPINNGLWDLYHLVMAFARHDRAFAGHRIPSLRTLFESAGAGEREPENLDPDALFALADLVSVRRDRRFIQKQYPDAIFPDGTPVRFPTPELTTARYDLDAAYPGLVRAVTSTIESLTMARYCPSAYRKGGAESARETQLSGLLRSGILKRFESCWDACHRTIGRIVRAHELFLAAWKEGWVLGGDSLREAAREHMEEAGLAESLAEGGFGEDREPIAEFDPAYEQDVAKDLTALRSMEARLAALDADADPKLAWLRRLVRDSPSTKVIVFSTFADTIRYLDQYLPEKVGGRTRITVIGSDTDPDERMGRLARFAPKTVIREDYEPEEGEVDLLLSNDVLSEGQNLQQAGAVISYDMPWNPQRVVQRYGRVIRLKSEHDRVFLTTMLPAPGDLEPILALEAAIRRKTHAASVYGMEVEVVEGDLPEVRAFTDRLIEGDLSLLDESEHADPGQALSGEGLRAELARWIQEMGVKGLRDLPWGTGAVFRRALGHSWGASRGWFFACRTRNDERYWRWVGPDGETSPEPDAAILRRIHPRGAPGLLGADYQTGEGLEHAWRAAVRSIVAEHNELVAAEDSSDAIGPLQAWAVGEILEDPEIALPDGGEAAAEALRVGRGSIVRRTLGQIRRRVAEGKTSKPQAALEIVDLVRTEGLRPADPPERLETISDGDVGVVCWMEILPSAD